MTIPDALDHRFAMWERFSDGLQRFQDKLDAVIDQTLAKSEDGVPQEDKDEPDTNYYGISECSEAARSTSTNGRSKSYVLSITLNLWRSRVGG